jgi:hypothetical protein
MYRQRQAEAARNGSRERQEHTQAKTGRDPQSAVDVGIKQRHVSNVAAAASLSPLLVMLLFLLRTPH